MTGPPQMPGMIVGVRHPRRADRDCGCGCAAVVGVSGSIVQDDDTSKLARLDPPMALYAFDVRSVTSDTTREHVIAYELTDLVA